MADDEKTREMTLGMWHYKYVVVKHACLIGLTASQSENAAKLGRAMRYLAPTSWQNNGYLQIKFSWEKLGLFLAW